MPATFSKAPAASDAVLALMSSFEIESLTLDDNFRSIRTDSAVVCREPTFSTTSSVVAAPFCCSTELASVVTPAFTSMSSIVVSKWLELVSRSLYFPGERITV